MPNIKSQMKRDRQNIGRNQRNIAVKSELKTLTKNYLTALEEKDKNKAEEALKSLSKAYDNAVSKGIVHKNMASRKKSQFAKKLA